MFTIVKIFILSCFITTLIEYPIMAGGSFEECIQFDEELLIWYPIVAVVKIKNINDPLANTNANPPKLEVEILEIIRGNIHKGKFNAIWIPFYHGVDWSGGESNKLIKEWGKILNPSPDINSKWIIAGEIYKNLFYIAPRCRYKFDK